MQRCCSLQRRGGWRTTALRCATADTSTADPTATAATAAAAAATTTATATATATATSAAGVAPPQQRGTVARDRRLDGGLHHRRRQPLRAQAQPPSEAGCGDATPTGLEARVDHARAAF